MKRAHPKFVTVGYVNIDINVTPSKKTVLPGGAAYFAALAASRIIKPVGLVTRIGSDYKNPLLFKRVQSEGITVVKNKKTPRSTQIYYSDTDLTKRDITMDWGVAPDINPQDFPKVWLQEAEIIHIATMPPLQQKSFIDFLTKHTKALLSIDTDVFLLKDPKSKKQVIENFLHCDIVFANRVEYASLKPLFKKLKHAVIKLDKEGAIILEHGIIKTRYKGKKVQAVDVTGAGDIFAGTYLAGKLKGYPEERCLQEACETATLSVTREGVTHLF